MNRLPDEITRQTEVAWYDTDNSEVATTDGECLAQDTCFTEKTLLPQPVTQYDNPITPRCCLFTPERATDERLESQGVEDIVIQRPSDDSFGPVGTGQVCGVEKVGPERLEDVRLLTVSEPFVVRYAKPPVGVGVPNGSDTVSKRTSSNHSADGSLVAQHRQW